MLQLLVQSRQYGAEETRGAEQRKRGAEQRKRVRSTGNEGCGAQEKGGTEQRNCTLRPPYIWCTGVVVLFYALAEPRLEATKWIIIFKKCP